MVPAIPGWEYYKMETKKILIVEDEFFIANNIKVILESSGYTVTSIVATGEGAIQRVERETPDLVLMDIELNGEMDGIETVNEIHARYDMPVIYMTAYTDEKLLERAKLTEPFGYLVKPVNERELQTNIEMALYKHKTENRLKEMNRNLEKRVLEEMEKRIQKEQLLIQQSKMAAMGEMIGAIAHQWRQPLNSINIIAQDLPDAYKFGELDEKYIKEAAEKTMNLVDYMSQTIDDFRDFFKPSKERVPFKVNTAIKEIIQLLYYQLIKADIGISLSCTYEGATKKPPLGDRGEICICKPEIVVTGYPNEFKQAILNLLTNARDAIIDRKEQGLLKEEKQGLISIEISRENQLAVTKINDNGGGISEESLKKIFEPYFTTKGDDGTGIGLYMCKTIIENHMGGRIRAKNIGEGAEFRLELKMENDC